jgi:hypothetical protein
VTPRQASVCRHRKSRSWRPFQSLVIRAGNLLQAGGLFYFCTSTELLDCSMYQRNLFPATANRCWRRELFHGTNFRHAVEFSRSGCAPSRTFSGRSGATRDTLPGWCSPVKPGTFQLPAWSNQLRQSPAVRSHLEECSSSPRGLPGDPPERFSVPARSGVVRTRRTLASAGTQSQIAPVSRVSPPCFRGFRPDFVGRQVVIIRVWPG